MDLTVGSTDLTKTSDSLEFCRVFFPFCFNRFSLYIAWLCVDNQVAEKKY